MVSRNTSISIDVNNRYIRFFSITDSASKDNKYLTILDEHQKMFLEKPRR